MYTHKFDCQVGPSGSCSSLVGFHPSEDTWTPQEGAGTTFVYTDFFHFSKMPCLFFETMYMTLLCSSIATLVFVWHSSKVFRQTPRGGESRSLPY